MMALLHDPRRFWETPMSRCSFMEDTPLRLATPRIESRGPICEPAHPVPWLSFARIRPPAATESPPLSAPRDPSSGNGWTGYAAAGKIERVGPAKDSYW